MTSIENLTRLRRLRRLLVTAAGIWAAALQAQAPLQAQEPVFSGRHLFVEQDEFAKLFGLGGDQNYTMGVGLQLTGRFVRWTLPGQYHFAMDRLVGLTGLPLTPDDNLHESFHSITLVGSAFTPDDITQTTPVVGDRPYGSILAIVTRRVSPRGNEDQWAVSTEMAVGALGLGVADHIQTWIHQKNGSDIPMGWDTQISDGGELTGYYRLGVQHRLTPFFNDGAEKRFEASAEADLWLGYYTNVSAGGSARLGKFYSRYFEFSSAPVLGGSQALVRHRSENEWFVFGATRGRLVGYNALLQGQRKTNPYELSGDQIKRAIMEVELGAHFTAGLGKTGFNLYGTWVMVAGRSPEISTSFGRWHWWGSAHLGLTRALGTP